MPKPRHTETLILPNLDARCDIVAAGEDSLFGEVVPDQWTAYARVRFGKALPMVVGPESINGAVFGMHPAVLARSYPGIVHKQVNLGHTLRVLGKKEDRICGCVLQAAFPEEPEGGWTIVDSVDDAPHITVLSALFKQAHGVPKMLGDHLGAKVEMSVSMEFTYYYDEMGIHDPSNKMTYDRSVIPTNLKGYIYEDEKGRLGIRKNSRNPGLVIAVGGVSGRIWFSGFGYTPQPAESTAGIESIAASHRAGMMVAASTACLPEVSPGMKVTWPGGQYGSGKVMAVLMDGTHTRHHKTLHATPQNPALDILLPNGVRILRTATSVRSA
jgi:hypothetical protein